MIHFKCLYTNILLEDAINSIKELVKKFDDVLPNAGLIIKLLSLIHKKSLMAFNREYFKQNFRVIMGKNNVPIHDKCYQSPVCVSPSEVGCCYFISSLYFFDKITICDSIGLQ